MLSGILLGHSQTTYRVALEASKLDVTTAVEWILGALYTLHLMVYEEGNMVHITTDMSFSPLY